MATAELLRNEKRFTAAILPGVGEMRVWRTSGVAGSYCPALSAVGGALSWKRSAKRLFPPPPGCVKWCWRLTLPKPV